MMDAARDAPYQFLDVDHLLQRNLLTFLGTQLFDKRQFGKKEETGKEITTLLQPQRTYLPGRGEADEPVHELP